MVMRGAPTLDTSSGIDTTSGKSYRAACWRSLLFLDIFGILLTDNFAMRSAYLVVFRAHFETFLVHWTCIVAFYYISLWISLVIKD